MFHRNALRRFCKNESGITAVEFAFVAPIGAGGGSAHADGGPLAGVLAGLRFSRARGCDFVCTLSVDAPFAPSDLVARLHAARRAAHADIAVAASGGRRHHVVALWPVALEEELARALAEGVRKVEAYAARHAVAEAEWPTTPHDPFFNVNRPDDLARAEAMARSG